MTAGGGGKSEIDREKGFTGKCSKYDEKGGSDRTDREYDRNSGSWARGF